MYEENQLDDNGKLNTLAYLQEILKCERKLIDVGEALDESHKISCKLGIPVQFEQPMPPQLEKVKIFDKELARSIGWAFAMFILGAILSGIVGVEIFVLGTSIAGIVRIVRTLFTNVKRSNACNKHNRKNLVEYNYEYEKYNYAIYCDQLRVANECSLIGFYHEQENQLHNLQYRIKDTLSVLYERSGLKPAYHNAVAASSIYYSLTNGLTRSLEVNGADKGAYNIYEESSRAGRNTQSIIETIKETGSQIGSRFSSTIGSLKQQLSVQNKAIYEAINENTSAQQLNNERLLQELISGQSNSQIIQEAMLEQERLKTLALSRGFYKKYYNQDGYRIR